MSLRAPLWANTIGRRLGMALAVAVLLPSTGAADGELSAALAFELRSFASDPVAPDQADGTAGVSLAFEPEYVHEFDSGRDLFVFTGFVRYDGEDGERTHADVRELYWQRTGRDWELSVGFREIFWGVTESRHLVNVLNQTDLVEDLDGEDKLGQPMIDFTWLRSWGTLQFFLMPGFRERTFPGVDARARTAPLIVPDLARYESSAKEDHVDWAVRWSHSFGMWDVGVAHFSGTARDPLLIPEQRDGDSFVLAPFYEQIERTSVDLQATHGGLLWKLEAIAEKGSRESFGAAVGGLEYTFFNLGGSGLDIGALAEYLYDERDDGLTTPFQDDLFLGTRLAFNDPADTNLLIGAIVDRQNGGTLLEIEGSRRLAGNFKLGVIGRAFLDFPSDDFLATLGREDYLQLTLTRYF